MNQNQFSIEQDLAIKNINTGVKILLKPIKINNFKSPSTIKTLKIKDIKKIPTAIEICINSSCKNVSFTEKNTSLFDIFLLLTLPKHQIPNPIFNTINQKVNQLLH